MARSRRKQRSAEKKHEKGLPFGDLGNATAESDENLPDYYVGNRYFDLAKDISARQVFLIGDKGIGKSAVLEMVRREASGHKIISLGAEDIGLGLLSNATLLESMGATDLGIIYRAVWDYIILINIVKSQFGTSKPAWWQVMTPKEEKEVFDLLQQTGELEEGSMNLSRAFLDILQRLRLKLSVEGPGGNSCSLETSLGDRMEKDIGKMMNEIRVLRHIKRLRQELPLKCQHSCFYVLIDDLDEGWNNTPAQRECLRALVGSLVRLQHFPNVRFIVALRRVIFEQLHVADPDKVRDVVTEMRWTKADLREIVLRRMASALSCTQEHVDQFSAPPSSR